MKTGSSPHNEVMKRLLPSLGILSLTIFGLSVLAQNGPSSPGISFAQPGTTASFKLELAPAKGVLFNRRGPSKITLSHPYGKPLEVSLKEGQVNAEEPEEYWDSVPSLEFRLPIPKNAKPGSVQLETNAVLFLCDKGSNICYREARDLKIELRIGATGQNKVTVLTLEAPK
jgi:hypothetical protein